MIQRVVLRRIFLLLVFLGCSAHAAPRLSFAVVPQFSAQEVFADWTPVLREVSKRSGVELSLKLYESIPDFEDGFLKGEPDIAYMNPYHAVMANTARGYLPILRDDASRLSGILVVRKDSPITELSQLNGAKIAFPAPNAFGASLYMRALLTREANVNFTPVYVKTHPNVFRNVILGQTQAGGAVRRTLNDESAAVQEQLRVLYETPPSYSHPISVHPRVPAQQRQAVQKAFVAMGKDPAFARMLKQILIPSPVKSGLQDYTPLEKLGLEKFVVTSDK